MAWIIYLTRGDQVHVYTFVSGYMSILPVHVHVGVQLHIRFPPFRGELVCVTIRFLLASSSKLYVWLCHVFMYAPKCRDVGR